MSIVTNPIPNAYTNPASSSKQFETISCKETGTKNIPINGKSNKSSGSHGSINLSEFESLKFNDHSVLVKSKQNAKYICELCNQIMLDPVQTCRGELACDTCYKSKKGKRSVCPIDGQPISDQEVFPDKSILREIKNLRCICINVKHGCQWSGALFDINSHEKSCEYRLIHCELCRDQIILAEKLKHHEKECIFRKVRCTFCNKEVVLVEKEEHEAFCEEKPFRCTFNCDAFLTVKDIFNHVDECPRIVNGHACPYSTFGCTFAPETPESQKSHLADCTMNHLALVAKTVERLNLAAKSLNAELQKEKTLRFNLETKLKSYEERIDSIPNFCGKELNSKNSQNDANKLLQLENKVNDFNENLSELERFISNFKFDQDERFIKLLSMESKLSKVIPDISLESYLKKNDDIAKVKESVEQFERTQAQCVSRICDAEMSLQLLENTTYTGRIIWRVDNFMHRQKQAEMGKITVLHSAPCYTKLFEYKYCLRLYLNGDGIGRNTHISLFICFMKSAFDDQLSWPVQKKVTFRLINIKDKSKTRQEQFITDKISSSFRKPVKEMNVAAGCPLFIDKESVFPDGFVIDDCIYIETLVE